MTLSEANKRLELTPTAMSLEGGYITLSKTNGIRIGNSKITSDRIQIGLTQLTEDDLKRVLNFIKIIQIGEEISNG
jgi:hypothetical protein